MDSEKMKAAVFSKYGPPEVVKLREVIKPKPKQGEVLIRVHATTVNSGDARLRRADPFIVRLIFGLFKPRKPILGVDFAGVIDGVGNEVNDFSKGDEVFGSSFASSMGAHAEYICVPVDSILLGKPKNLTFEESASLFFGANTSLHFLKAGKISKGSKVLVYGASGALGVYAVQLAKYYGAEVSAVCSAKNVDLVKSLGADKVIPYDEEDFTKSESKYDIIYDTIGKSPFANSVKSLFDQGYYVRAVHMSFSSLFRGMLTQLLSKKKVIGGVATETIENLMEIKSLAEAGKVKPVVDRIYNFSEIVEAHRYVDTGRKKGSVVVKIV